MNSPITVLHLQGVLLWIFGIIMNLFLQQAGANSRGSKAVPWNPPLERPITT